MILWLFEVPRKPTNQSEYLHKYFFLRFHYPRPLSTHDGKRDTRWVAPVRYPSRVKLATKAEPKIPRTPLQQNETTQRGTLDQLQELTRLCVDVIWPTSGNGFTVCSPLPRKQGNHCW